MRRTRAIWLAICASLAAHVVWLAAAANVPLRASPTPRAVQPIQIRLVASLPQSQTALGRAEESLANDSPPATVVLTPAHHDRKALNVSAPEPEPKPARMSAPEGIHGYVLRQHLTSPPRPKHEVPLAWPPGWFPSGTLTGVFTLYIDEQGMVRRAVADGPTLPPRLELAAEKAFEATRFDPGRILDRAVKSLIRVEVEFTDTMVRQPEAKVVNESRLCSDSDC